MNLANNHAFDYGERGSGRRSLRCGGRAEHTGRPGQVTVQRVGQIRVALVGFASYPWSRR